MKVLHCFQDGFSYLASLSLLGKAIVVDAASLNSYSGSSVTRAVHTCNGNDTRMPAGAWDSHLHVLDPDRFPPLPDAAYTPGVYTVWDNAIFEHRLGAEHPVMIQPSIYGYNNTLVLDSLKAYGPDRARAVLVFDVNTTSTEQLAEWDALGARGIRLNFITDGITIPVEELKQTIQQYADAVRPFNWVLQLYFAMETLTDVEDFLSNLDVRIVLDHFGHPDIPEPSDPPKAIDPYSLAGFGSLARLLKHGNTWVKISAAYRFSKLSGPDYSDMDPLILELFRIAPSRIVYASDWPHTQFEGLDIKPWTEHLLDLTDGDSDLRQKLFADNPRELWSTNTTDGDC